MASVVELCRLGFRIAGLSALLLAGCAHAAEPTRDSVAVWTGLSTSPDSFYGYAGAAAAFGGDLDSEGIVSRIGAGGGEYRTDGNNSHDVLHYDADLMLGYRLMPGDSVVTLFAGASVETHDNDDDDSEFRGTKLGIKAQAELYLPLGDAIYVSAFGNYSTAFGTFNASVKTAYQLTDDLSIGPEAAVLGSQSFDQTRTGLAAAYNVMPGAEIALSAGYAWAMDEEREGGAYGVINLYTRF